VRVLDRILDRSILFSFDRSGFRRHERQYQTSDLDRSMHGRICLVTGGNRGIGYEVSRGLAIRGAQVHILCRDLARGEQARRSISEEVECPHVHLHAVDVSDIASVRRFARSFTASRIDVLVHNAGVLPSKRILTDSGIELTVATHLVGPFLLTQLLRTRLEHARVIFVSSGGMYARRLDVRTMISNAGEYSGVAAYAMTKRAQVVLSELLADDLADAGCTVNAMHPGWAATRSVERALPRFYRVMKRRLRSPGEGADTVVWLAVAERVRGETGRFWFDRSPVSTHLTRRTIEDDEQRALLWSTCVDLSGLNATQ
jgi:NAD(P)-dependent dehydrogenase (short-subunit alcohol dehydrogenase family)